MEKTLGLVLLLLGYAIAVAISALFGLKLYEKTALEESAEK